MAMGFGVPELGEGIKSWIVRGGAYNEYMKFRVVLEFDPDTNSYSAICPELPGCASAGDTEEEARANIEEAIRLYLAPVEISLPDKAKLSEVTIG